jgi:hypothetical protein
VEEREGATSTSTSAITSTNTNTSTSRLHLHLRLQHSITTYSVAKDHGKLSLPKTVARTGNSCSTLSRRRRGRAQRRGRRGQ